VDRLLVLGDGNPATGLRDVQRRQMEPAVEDGKSYIR
jgi:hypothetical protein